MGMGDRPGPVTFLAGADRLCLALADRLGVVAWTADAAWGDGDTVHQVGG